MKHKKCSVCGEYGFFNCASDGPFIWNHRCKPQWWVWEDAEEDGRTVFAVDAEAAAEKYCYGGEWDTYVHWDCGPPEETLAFVKPFKGDDTPTKWCVSGELVPEFHATRRDR